MSPAEHNPGEPGPFPPGGPQQWLAQYRFMLDHTPAMLWTATPGGQVDYVNEWMLRYTGRPAGQLLGEGWLDVVHPGDRERVVYEWQHALREGTASRVELRFRRADGAYRWHQRSVIPYRDGQGNLARWVGVNTDIEDQKGREAARRELLGQREAIRDVLHAQEAERERIAESVHNGLGQVLFAVRLNLQKYLARTPEDDAAAGPLRKADALLQEAIVQSRIISADLVPAVLLEYGLAAALKDLTGTLSTPARRIELRLAGLEERLAPALELDVFRIVQALLGQVLQPEADRVDVLLVRSGNGLSLLVENNGKGFTEDELAALNQSTGVGRVRSRAALLGGRVSLESTPGAGTAVRVFLPLAGPSTNQT
jgi:PAS domain S-box-containing protein